jgi:excisionase family DNA binding protein
VETVNHNIVNASNSGGLKKLKTGASLISRQYYNIKEVADFFNVHHCTIRRLIDDGDIQVIKMRTCVRISVQEIKKLEKRLKFDVFK